MTAWMTWTRDGYDLRFVGDRPFRVPDFMRLAETFHHLLLRFSDDGEE